MPSPRSHCVARYPFERGAQSPRPQRLGLVDASMSYLFVYERFYQRCPFIVMLWE